MVTVGVLAALINIIVLFVVAIADRAIELIVRNFATSRLINHRRAPVVHDSDTWLPFLPRSVIKYHRHPAILCTVLCTILLITAELVCELGVDVSNTCKPVAERGKVISPGGITDSFTYIELSGTCFLLQSLKFEGELKRIRAGIPRSLNGRECFKCIDASSPDIVSDCDVHDRGVYKAGELKISINTTQGTFKTVTSSFQETNDNQTLFEGCGDLTYNGHEVSTFLLHKRADTRRVLYFEYNDQDHLNIMKGLAPKAKGTPVTELTRGPVHVSEIFCKTNVLDMTNFSEVIRMYRTVQLENPITPAHLDPKTNRFNNITADDIYRAVLAAKIIDDVHESDAVFYRYTSCGKYNWSFLFPMIICLAILIILGVASHIFRPSRLPTFQIPFNSRSWYHHARNLEDMCSPYQEEKKRKSGYFGNIFEELKLVDEGEDTLPHGRVVLSTRDDQVAREPSRFIGTGHMDSSTWAVEAFERNP